MTPPFVEPRFQLEYGCTLQDWHRALPGAVRDAVLTLQGELSATVAVGSGHLNLQWQELPPRRIALMTMPRMMVHFDYQGTTAEQRLVFQRYFDLFMQRGGG